MWKITTFIVFLGLVHGFVLPPKGDEATPWLRIVSYEEKVKHQQEAYEKLQKAYSGMNLENIRSKLRILAGFPKEESKSVNVLQKNENGTYYIGGANIYEVNENAGISEYLFQGDILMTEEQLDHLLPKKGSRQKRSMIADPSRKWPKEGAKNFSTVPYKFEANYPLEWRPRVHAAIQFIQNNTCVRFRATKKSDKNFVEIINGEGCYTQIGMVNGAQPVSLGEGCMVTTTVIHELYHKLGAFHTQSRSDRDKYIGVDMLNVQPDAVYNFRKINATDEMSYGTPYEMDNIMHYGDRAFAINPNYWVLLARDEYLLYQPGMGGTAASTFYNIFEINKHYCQGLDKCRNSKTKCLNGGMRDPNNCKKCICPEPMGGNTCNKSKDGVLPVMVTPTWAPFIWKRGSSAEKTTVADIYPFLEAYRFQDEGKNKAANVFKTKSIAEILKNQGKQETSLEKKMILHELVFDTVVENHLSFRFVKSQSFTALMKFTCPLYTVPSRKFLFGEYLDQQVQMYTSKLAKLTENKPVCITVDEWSQLHSTTSLLSITLHFLDNNGFRVNFIGGCVYLEDLRHTADNYSVVVQKKLKDLQIDLKNVVSCVRDGASVMLAFTNRLNIDRSIHCANHLTQLAPVGMKVELNITLMEGSSYIHTCIEGGMEVKFKKDLRLAGAVFCPGRALPRQPIVSETNTMYVIFRTIHNNMFSKAEYRAV